MSRSTHFSIFWDMVVASWGSVTARTTSQIWRAVTQENGELNAYGDSHVWASEVNQGQRQMKRNGDCNQRLHRTSLTGSSMVM